MYISSSTGAGVSGFDVTGHGEGVSGLDVTGHGEGVSGFEVTGHGVEPLAGFRHPTEGNTHPHVLPFTISHTASSFATHDFPSYDGRYGWQSAIATSPFRGQALPAGDAPAPEHIAPRDAGELYVASRHTETGRSRRPATPVTATATNTSETPNVFILPRLTTEVKRDYDGKFGSEDS